MQLDSIMIFYFDHLFYLGRPTSDGMKLRAALKFIAPHIGLTTPLNLPRTQTALKGWVKIRPEVERLPFPLLALFAILGYLIHRQHHTIALHLYTQFRTYLRPGVSDQLTCGQLVSPAGGVSPVYNMWGLVLHPPELLRASKTGQYNQAVWLDHDPWLGPMLHKLTIGKSKDAPLWPHTGMQVRDLFIEAGHALCSSL